MRRLVPLLVVPLLLAAPANALAGDDQVFGTIHRYATALAYLVRHAGDRPGPTAGPRFAARCGRMAQRAGQRLARVQPSTPTGATVRRQAVHAFAQVRVGCRLFLLAVNKHSEQRERLLALGAVRLSRGFRFLASFGAIL